MRKKKIELQELLESKLNDQTKEDNRAESEGQQASQDDEGRDETPPRREEEEENKGRNVSFIHLFLSIQKNIETGK